MGQSLASDRANSEEQAERAECVRLLATLTVREREVIERRFGLCGRDADETLEMIGRSMGLTRERIRQIETQALAKMRRGSARSILRATVLAADPLVRVEVAK